MHMIIRSSVTLLQNSVARESNIERSTCGRRGKCSRTCFILVKPLIIIFVVWTHNHIYTTSCEITECANESREWVLNGYGDFPGWENRRCNIREGDVKEVGRTKSTSVVPDFWLLAAFASWRFACSVAASAPCTFESMSSATTDADVVHHISKAQEA